ncbi:hypothetical protein PTSG_06397 [Salpingoeca rosetta]|uniref:Translin n=1 Tax=Salpingoeca rosetta (strain ATCC 50818 / BSB-021) TaxID=946362 RepID=F2UCT0_SALR5|nr:uncharacterized protein PTSG_06397 [Salpingoeca rosetta]EGD74387.1 hypothetical protein PTSG_06397 [Salpingoeca rosetta]|eukprot:XP_004993287.1 hypothetical protein PTSG_06397 [Salpingoeca rosetta]
MSMFQWFQDVADAEQEKREAIKDVVKTIEPKMREIERALQQCHHLPADKVGVCTAEAAKGFEAMKALYAQLAEKVPPGEYYRYNMHWRWVTQQTVYLAALMTFLNDGSVIQLQDIQNLLGVTSNDPADFHIDVEDYLMGLCSLPSELTRLATNCVTMGDFERPVTISRFISNLYDAFKLLNLKNDSLRRKFDSLKYDVKNVEQVVYDLSIRGLAKAKPDQPQ